MQAEQNMLRISVKWRGRKLILDIDSNATLKDFGEELLRLTNIKADTMRLIVPETSKGSKLISPFADEYSYLSLIQTSIPEGKSIQMMGVSEDEVNEIMQNANENFRIAGFDEEERRLRQRMLDRHHTSLKLPQGVYIFCDFRTLHISGIELNPPPSEALKRMHTLAADPGIVAIMNKHQWRVGIMTEMAPVGYVGVSPKCILGFNKNRGEEISLRLRTDDLKGFRKYESIKKTLLHELAHMIHSEHDANFYALDKQLNEEAVCLDWTKSRSHTLRGTKNIVDEFYFEQSTNFSHKLGGESSNKLPSARASSVASAHNRFATVCINKWEGDEVNTKPDLDDFSTNTIENKLAKPCNLKTVETMKSGPCSVINEAEITTKSDVVDSIVSPPLGISKLEIYKLDPANAELQRIQDPVTTVSNRLQEAIRMLRFEVKPTEITAVMQTLFKIIRNLIEHPEEIKFRRLKMANPVFRRNVVNYKGAMEILCLVGFIEDVVLDEIGKVESYLVLKRNDPGLLWLAKSSLETDTAH